MDIDIVIALASDVQDNFDEEASPEYIRINLKNDDNTILIPVSYLRGDKEELRKELHKFIDGVIDTVGWS